jgi:hypothetical protein
MSGGVRHFRACGGARDLVETCINDLRMLSKSVDSRDLEQASLRARRTAVIILYATGEVGVTEGWAIDGNDFNDATLLSAPRQGEPL